LGHDARIFQDVQIQLGQRWTREIADALATSKVIVALLSRNYFQSDSCRRELAAMLARSAWLRDRGLDDHIIFPLIMHDCDIRDLPEVVRSLQFVRIHRYADPFMHPESARREELSGALRPLCEQVARRLEQVMDDDLVSPPPDDAKFRELLVPPARAKVKVPMLGGEP
jgi:hypothetical protein